MNNRLEQVRGKLIADKLDALLISSAENRRYLSGFTGTAGYLVITQNQAMLYTDFRYIEQSAQQAPDFQVVRMTGGYEWLPEFATEQGIRRIGFEASNLSYSIYKSFSDAFSKFKGKNELELLPTLNIVEPLRALKDANELALITEAVNIADGAFLDVSSTIEIGETERSIAWRLEQAMRMKGAEAISFESIVAVGPNAALPHHRADDTPVIPGVPIVMDFGARYEGYCSDMTRTIYLGKPDKTFRTVYDTVLGAQLAATVAIQEGLTCHEADGIARSIIDSAGHGEQFGHSLGHGIGLAVHEEPRVGPKIDWPLKNNTVFTIEPGIYIPGWGGVRIEDTVVMENGTVRSLTQSHKNENPR